MILGFFLISLVVLGEYFYTSQLARRAGVKEAVVALVLLLCGGFFIVSHGLTGQAYNTAFFSDWRFWSLIGLETGALALMLKCVHNNRHQMHVIGHFQFLTLPVIPILVYALDSVGLFAGALQMPFTAAWEWITFVTGNLILTLLFIWPKIKLKQTVGLGWLLALSACLTTTIIFSIKLIQVYEQAALMYGFIFLAMAAVNALLFARNLRRLNWQSDTWRYIGRTSLLCSLLFLGLWKINLIAAKLVPVELFAIFKRLAQASNSYVFDAIDKRSLAFMHRRDLLLIGGLLAFNLGLIYNVT